MLPLGFDESTPKKKLIYLANSWADFFIKSEYLSLDRDVSNVDLFSEICLCKWQTCGVSHVRRMLVSSGDALDRACHNKRYDISYLLQKNNPITYGYYSSAISVLIPDISIMYTIDRFIEAPKKYIPFLLLVKHNFNNIIFYNDICSCSYYNESDNNLYINTFFEDEDPSHVIYEVMAKKILPNISGKLWDIQSFQNIGIAAIDKTSDSLEKRFINDYISYKTDQNQDILVKTFFRAIGI